MAGRDMDGNYPWFWPLVIILALMALGGVATNDRPAGPDKHVPTSPPKLERVK